MGDLPPLFDMPITGNDSVRTTFLKRRVLDAFMHGTELCMGDFSLSGAYDPKQVNRQTVFNSLRHNLTSETIVLGYSKLSRE